VRRPALDRDDPAVGNDNVGLERLAAAAVDDRAAAPTRSTCSAIANPPDRGAGALVVRLADHGPSIRPFGPVRTKKMHEDRNVLSAPLMTSTQF